MINIRTTAIAGIVALGIASTANASSYEFEFDDHEDLLEQLIELDADGIDDLQDDLVEARNDISEAIADVEEARAEVAAEKGFAGIIARIAFGFASNTVSSATEFAFDEIRSELDLAEGALGDQRSSVGESEFKETTGAINMIRYELSEIEAALNELLAALDRA